MLSLFVDDAMRLRLPDKDMRQPRPGDSSQPSTENIKLTSSSFTSPSSPSLHHSRIERPYKPSVVQRETTNVSTLLINRPLRHVPKMNGRPGRGSRLGQIPTSRREDDWRNWIEVRLRIIGLPQNITTQEIWSCFSRYGSLASIKIFENSRGHRDGKAIVTFSPPPARSFWQMDNFCINQRDGGKSTVKVYLEPQNRTFFHPSPVNRTMYYPESMIIVADSLDFGCMSGPQTMMARYTITSNSRSGIVFKQDMLHREVVIDFRIDVDSRGELFRFSIPFNQLSTVYKIEGDPKKVELLASLDTPPRFFRKLEESDTHMVEAQYWSERDAWYRQTDIAYFPAELTTSPVALKKPNPIIDIGRWTTYRFSFSLSTEKVRLFKRIEQALRDYNITVKPLSGFQIASSCEDAVWKYIDRPIPSYQRSASTLEELLREATVPALPFPVRYQLEVCISQGYLNEHNLSKPFIDQLMGMDVNRAQDILEYVANQGKRLFEPMAIFDMKILKGSASRPAIPKYCVFMRSATVTPSTIYFNTPTVEISNRVVRHYAEHADRFLRVRFTDEKVEGKIHSTDKDTMDEVFTRIKRALRNGITIGDRQYEFLAFGNSQFRENGAYFFAPLPHLTPYHMRNWMGDFEHIPYVAQYAARLGQCFSTTRAIAATKPKVEEAEDVEHNGYNFTDGVGRISPFLARLISSELGIDRTSPDPPSAFQFRMGGCKGMLTVFPGSNQKEVTIRRSQYKFASRTEILEIIRCSQFAAANLNRQIILVLSALGVQDEIFLDKQKVQLADLEFAMTSETMALNMLQKDIDPNQMTLTIAGMILDGFQKSQEPFIKSLLQLWRAWSIKYLKEKARITIGEGAFLLGCVDETATLKGHYDSALAPPRHAPSDFKANFVPEVFVQLSKDPSGGHKPTTILGPMLLARNPSLHPGDIRIVRGVDVPALHHLKDVVVVPQTGDRPIVNMCSGGDLDGDDFLVIWDRELLPTEWNHAPMDFTPAEKQPLGRSIEPDDLTSFFVTYMKNDNLSRIAIAHLAYADYLDEGVKSDKCLRLAELHSLAVDYTKSGVPARMTRDLQPSRWPHFLESKYRAKEQIYHSKKVLGRLFDQVERVDFIPVFDSPFDERILTAYKPEQDLLTTVMVIKREYDAAMRRIMAQHDIKTEFEVWSTFVMSHSKASSDYKFHEEIGHISLALKDRFRERCYIEAGGKDFGHMAPFVVAMYTVTAKEIEHAVVQQNDTLANMPLMSFPWLFHGILGKIANRMMPIQGLAEDGETLIKV